MKKVRRIYHIDDDSDDIYFFELALSDYDNSIRVTGETDVEKALNNLATGIIERPDIFVVDWNMPKYSAIECIAIIRKMEKYHDVPIVVLTTSSNPVDRALAENNGAYFETKPASIKEMKEKIKDFIIDISMKWMQIKPDH
jgi:CheY-like chemotaxis protein